MVGSRDAETGYDLANQRTSTYIVRLKRCLMPDLLLPDVPQELIDALERRAALLGRTTEAEHRAILETSLREGRPDFWERAATLREQMRGRAFTPSEDLIRQDRDER